MINISIFDHSEVSDKPSNDIVPSKIIWKITKGIVGVLSFASPNTGSLKDI